MIFLCNDLISNGLEFLFIFYSTGSLRDTTSHVDFFVYIFPEEIKFCSKYDNCILCVLFVCV